MQFNPDDPICGKIFDPVIRAIVRYRKHPIILAINRKCNSKSCFDLEFIDRKNVLKEIKTCLYRNQRRRVIFRLR